MFFPPFICTTALKSLIHTVEFKSFVEGFSYFSPFKQKVVAEFFVQTCAEPCCAFPRNPAFGGLGVDRVSSIEQETQTLGKQQQSSQNTKNQYSNVECINHLFMPKPSEILKKKIKGTLKNSHIIFQCTHSPFFSDLSFS